MGRGGVIMVTVLKVGYDAFKLAAKIHKVYYFIHANDYIAGCGNDNLVYTLVTNKIEPEKKEDFVANVIPSAIQVFVEGDIVAYPILTSSDIIINNYDIADDFIYIGTALTETLDSEPFWTIKRITLVDGLATNKRSTKESSATWSNRVDETYY
jgi:hypothetical protein